MAIRKRLTSTWRGPSVYDDAIDWSRTPRADYVRYRDPAIVRYHEGAVPVLWSLRDLKQSEMAHLRDYADRGELASCYQRAFVIACEGCSDTELTFERLAVGMTITDEAFESIPTPVWMELGALAYQRAGVLPGEALRFALPRGSPPIPTQPVDTTAAHAAGSAPDHRSGGPEDATQSPTT